MSIYGLQFRADDGSEVDIYVSDSPPARDAGPAFESFRRPPLMADSRVAGRAIFHRVKYDGIWWWKSETVVLREFDPKTRSETVRLSMYGTNTTDIARIYRSLTLLR
jgi:hypothetical protein